MSSPLKRKKLAKLAAAAAAKPQVEVAPVKEEVTPVKEEVAPVAAPAPAAKKKASTRRGLLRSKDSE